jgi:hypothetical protein
MSTTYYHTSVSAGSEVSRATAFQVRGIPLSLSANLSDSLDAEANLFLLTPSYTLPTKVFGGQASVGLMTVVGAMSSSLGASLNGNLSSPIGGLSFARTGHISESVFAIGDLYPQAALRWNFGVHNVMAYMTGDIPVGYYNSRSLVNVGIGHAAIDAGGSYSYFDPGAGREASATLGFTYNFQNPATQYQNGVDMHLDVGASQFLNEHLFAGVVGYLYREIGCDSGGAAVLGCFQSQVLGAGPQLGLVFPLAGKQAVLTLKSYKEFAAQNRPSGFNVWVGFTLSNPLPATR